MAHTKALLSNNNNNNNKLFEDFEIDLRRLKVNILFILSLLNRLNSNNELKLVQVSISLATNVFSNWVRNRILYLVINPSKFVALRMRTRCDLMFRYFINLSQFSLCLTLQFPCVS